MASSISAGVRCWPNNIASMKTADSGPGCFRSRPQRLPSRSQRCPVSGNVLLPRQPEQGALSRCSCDLAVSSLSPQAGPRGGRTRPPRIALYRAGINSKGLSKPFAIWRSDVAQCRLVCSGSSADVAMMAIASAKRGFDQDRGLGHWDRCHCARDGWGWRQVYPMSFWEYVNVI